MNQSKAFAWGVILLAFALFVLAFTARTSETVTLTDFLFWTALVMISEILPVSLGFGTQVTMAFPIIFAVALVFPPWAAMAIAGLGSFDFREIRRDIALHRALFNRAQSMLAVGGASLVFEMFGVGRSLGSLWVLIPIVLATLLRLATNLALVSIAVSLDMGIELRKALRGMLPDPVSGFFLTYALLTGIGVAMALADLRWGPLAVIAFFAPLLFARLSILGARSQQELSERIRKQQQALLEATEKVFQERENERKRIAEDIHDSSLQMLAAAAYGCGNANDFLDAGRTDHAQRAIAGAHDALKEAIKGLRESLVDLRRSSVEEGGLMETIQKFSDQVSTVWGTNVVIKGDVHHEPPIPVALAAFQILQEGLVNAMKHAQSSTIFVTVSDQDGMVHIVVEDTGPGFDPEAAVGADHVGMRLMKERAARVGGRILLDSRIGLGTRLEAILPGGVTQ
jgi:signal transduction histidine kinase